MNATLAAKEWPIWLLLAAGVVVGLYFWPQLPAQVPIHWNLHGQVDGWGPSWVNALLAPLLNLAIYLVMLLILRDRALREDASSQSALRVLRVGFVLFIGALQGVLLWASFETTFDASLVIRLAVPSLLIVLGTQLSRLKRNPWAGIRTPATLASDAVWEKTHQLGGRLWVAGGLVQLLAALLPPVPGFTIFFGVLLVMVLVPMVYAHRLAKASS